MHMEILHSFHYEYESSMSYTIESSTYTIRTSCPMFALGISTGDLSSRGLHNDDDLHHDHNGHDDHHWAGSSRYVDVVEPVH